MDSMIDTSLEQFRYKGDCYTSSDGDTITVFYYDDYCNVASLNISKSDIFADESWVVYSKDGKFLITYLASDGFERHEDLVKYKVKEGTEIICDSAFGFFCKKLREIIIPDSVYAIGREAFCGCDSLSSIKLPCQLEVIKEKTFGGCRELSYIKLPESIKRIEDNAFEFCGSLYFVFLAQNVEYVAPTAFNTGTVTPTIIVVPNLTEKYYSNLLKDSGVIIQSVEEFNNEQAELEQKRKGQLPEIWSCFISIVVCTLIGIGVMFLVGWLKSCM